MHKGYRPGSHSAKRHEDPHVVVSTHLSDGGSIKAMHAAISADSVLIARWALGAGTDLDKLISKYIRFLS